MRLPIAAVALLSFFSCLQGGCYRPNIPNGSFKCSADKLCPDGYMCSDQGLCINGPLDLGAGNAFSGKLGPLEVPAGSKLVYFHEGANGGNITIGSEGGTPLVTSGKEGYVYLPAVVGVKPAVAIWSFSECTIGADSTLRLSSSGSDAALIIACSQNLTLDGDVDVSGYGGLAGGSGSDGKTANSPTGAGTGTKGDGGGGGGGYGAAGSSGQGTDVGTGGPAYGSTDLEPIFLGSGGGGAKSTFGGGGGSAIGLLAQGTLTIRGKINATGRRGGDAKAASGSGGGGGGSGGSILLSGASISFGTGHELNALGGAGGSGDGTMIDGGAGGEGRIRIAGPTDTTPTATPMPSTDGNALTQYPTAQ